MKSTKILALLSIVLFLAGTAYALDYTIDSHSINIQVAIDGSASVIERFEISFPTDIAKTAFRENSVALGTDLSSWQKLNPEFTPSLGQNTLNKKISYTEGQPNYLEISYDLAETLMAKGKETTMASEYNIKVNFFNSFYQAGQWIIPDKTLIKIELPPGAEISGSVEPQATITTAGTKKSVTWQGYKSGNSLVLNYVLWKKINTVIDPTTITNFLFRTQEGLIILALIVIAIVLLAWKRKNIGRGVENFVEKNSIIREE